MHAQADAIESGTDGPRGWQVALMTGGTLAALALMVATLGWNAGRGRGAASDRPVAGGAEAADLTAPPGGEATTSAGSRAAASDVIIYIVASQDEAEVARAVTVAEWHRGPAPVDKTLLYADAVVVRSPEEEAAVRGAIADADGIRAGLGLSPITVIDLREPSRVAPSPQRGRSREGAPVE
jgi:hypothetical protein